MEVNGQLLNLKSIKTARKSSSLTWYCGVLWSTSLNTESTCMLPTEFHRVIGICLPFFLQTVACGSVVIDPLRYCVELQRMLVILQDWMRAKKVRVSDRIITKTVITHFVLTSKIYTYYGSFFSSINIAGYSAYSKPKYFELTKMKSLKQ